MMALGRAFMIESVKEVMVEEEGKNLLMSTFSVIAVMAMALVGAR